MCIWRSYIYDQTYNSLQKIYLYCNIPRLVTLLSTILYSSLISGIVSGVRWTTILPSFTPDASRSDPSVKLRPVCVECPLTDSEVQVTSHVPSAGSLRTKWSVTFSPAQMLFNYVRNKVFAFFKRKKFTD